jgi:hypothetical protein
MLDFTDMDIIQEFESIIIGRCIKVYKSYTTQYKFRIYQYNEKDLSTSQIVCSNKYIRPTLNKHYKNGRIKEIDPSLLAKIKLMER